ncbi:ATP-binding cassette domain-containing protein [Sulfurimonas sp. SAG-AH-194-L11]|nr:ATP-binding cassette domain-containing protein [Sulfurimonas sp. SAG-AH-194-L11]MDF1877993.1 ATP-binding cassette domain-containing protein [Sulfurimonas sp. SAG-AH-194-L11]
MNFNKIIELWSHIDQKRKIQVVGLVFLTVVSSFAEIMSIGSIIPFFSIFSDSFSSGLNLPIYIRNIINEFSKIELLYIFIAIVITSGVIRLFLMYYINKITYWIANDIVSKAFNNILHDEYETHLYINSSSIIATCTTKIKDLTNHIINPLITLVSYGLLSIIIISFLSLINFNVTMYIAFTVISIYVAITFAVKGILLRLGAVMTHKQNLVQKTLQEGLSSIRDVIVMNLFKVYTDKFANDDKEMRDATSNIIILSQIPKYIIEMTIIIMIVTLSYYFIEIEKKPELIPIIVAITVGAQRLLPLLQQTFWSYSQLYGGNESLIDILFLLNKENDYNFNFNLINFSKSIELKNLSFKYLNSDECILEDINISIAKGQVIGIVGETGSGKSTLVDLILGLVKPTAGSVIIDGVNLNDENKTSWYKLISHVPQNIFLIDGTIKENITLGSNPDEIDQKRLISSIKLSCLEDFIMNDSEYGLDTNVGEKGSRVSGGQKQRIGIARALYRNLPILVFDESTNALDIQTENKIINNILNHDKTKTIIMITHRPESLNNCDMTIEVVHKNLKIKSLKRSI